MGSVESSTRGPAEPSQPEWTPRHFRLAIDAAGIGLWSWNVDTDRLVMDQSAYGLWGMSPAPTVTFADLSSHIHPQDRDRVRAAFAATRAIVGPYEIDFRIMIGDEVCWISARGQGNDADIVDRIMFGVFIDVTGRKQAEEANELLAGEMSHRVKNLLTIATALTNITSRSTATAVDMARDLTQRLSALGRAHDLVRPLPGGQESGALLGDLLSILLAPYEDATAFSSHIRVAVPRMSVGESAATALAMVIHELATNSLKYGALSTETGALDVAATIQGETVVLVWTERGGPAVSEPAAHGFGNRFVQRTVGAQLGGVISYEWDGDGLIVKLTMAAEALGR